jgi:2-dehydro-3-deoxyglucarate aldolase
LAGFDWILLDAEHAPNDVLTLIPAIDGAQWTA